MQSILSGLGRSYLETDNVVGTANAEAGAGNEELCGALENTVSSTTPGLQI